MQTTKQQRISPLQRLLKWASEDLADPAICGNPERLEQERQVVIKRLTPHIEEVVQLAWARLPINTDNSKIATLVSSPCVGCAIEQGLIFIENIPRNIVDVERKSIDQTANGGRPKNDAVIGQPLHDAIIEAQLVGARLVRYVEPQNLFFIFSESFQALKNVTPELPSFENTTQRGIDSLDNSNTQDCATQQQPNPNNRAIVLCHVLDAQCLQQLTGSKKQEGQNDTNCYQVLWSQLERLKNVLEKFGGHGAPVTVEVEGIVAQGGAA